MQRKHRLWLLAALIVCAVTFVVLAVAEQNRRAATEPSPSLMAPRDLETPVPAVSAQSAPGAASSPGADGMEDAEVYLVREYRGFIAVFASGDTTPSMITETAVSSLRETDQELLRQGVTLYSRLELAHFLEDFLS